jgi:IclR family pca regulon transcriptional regulator
MTPADGTDAYEGNDPPGLTQEDIERSLRFSSSLAAGLSLLNCFSAERPVLSIAKLAEQLNMTRSTTHRYASTLVALGYLEQDYARQYRLAPRVADFGLSMLASMTLRQHAGEHLRGLRERTGRTVSMVILDGTQIRYVERLRGWRRGQHEISLDVGLATRLPVYCTATGKILLAHLSAQAREQLLSRLTLTKHGPNCITDRRKLRAELRRARADGLAIGDEELAPGLRAIAAPVLGAGGEAVGAIGVSVPSAAFTCAELVEVMGPELTSVATRIAAAVAA